MHESEFRFIIFNSAKARNYQTQDNIYYLGNNNMNRIWNAYLSLQS